MTAALSLFLSLVAVHALCDFPLKGEFLSHAMRGGHAGFPWPLALSAHAMIHAGGVALVTGSWALGLAEFFSHWLTDCLKARGAFGNWIDAACHVGSKAVWALVAVFMQPGF
jgi:hypothetical protein